MHFQEISDRLYIYDVYNNLKIKNTKKNDFDYLFVSTIQYNENKFTSHKIEKAKLAMDLRKKLGQPSYDHYPLKFF